MGEAIQILLADDNAADRLVVREMLNETKLTFHVDEVTNGEDALAFLKREGRYASSPKPQLIILDLNMPKVGGKEFLEQAGNLLDGVNIVVFSGSPVMVEVASTIPHLWMVKPSTNEEFDTAVAALKEIIRGL